MRSCVLWRKRKPAPDWFILKLNPLSCTFSVERWKRRANSLKLPNQQDSESQEFRLGDCATMISHFP